MNAIEIHELTRDYGGGRGVFDVSITIKTGEAFGFRIMPASYVPASIFVMLPVKADEFISKTTSDEFLFGFL